ncbi:MAG: hypothetical protein M5U19_12590 [Microthrixaceae bacterium]|nr:hypothetical protein [Microthrixaceae bacterium]
MKAAMALLSSAAQDSVARDSDSQGSESVGNASESESGSCDSAEDEWFAFFDQSPLSGLSNPLSPPLVLSYDPADASALRGHVNFGTAYEGPPGFVHGGYVAAVFDELLGATQSLSGTQGMTAHLGVDYRSPTPGRGSRDARLGRVDRGPQDPEPRDPQGR